MKPEIMRVTQQVAAAVLGVTRHTLAQWREAPRNEDRTYNLPQLVQWRIERIIEDTAAVSSGGAYSEAQRRWKTAKADIAELDLAQRRGELLRLDDVVTKWGRLLDGLKRQLLSLPRILAPKLHGLSTPDISVSLDAELRNCIAQIATEYTDEDNEGSELAE